LFLRQARRETDEWFSKGQGGIGLSKISLYAHLYAIIVLLE
jgi:hypothetical protein